MSVFTDAELRYLETQKLGRLVTLAGDGSPQVRPVVFTWNAELDTVDIRGLRMAASRKFRNIAADPRVSFVVDDLASTDPWRPRGLEIRGIAEALEPSGGSEAAASALIRVHARRVLGWGLDDEPFAPPNARDVGGPVPA